jgi:RNA polymerase sigma-70 factor (ECF subfamily)
MPRDDNGLSQSERWTELLVRAQRGERGAFEKLVEEAHPVIWKRVFARLGDEGLADEVATRTFSRAWENRGSYDPELANARTWLSTIADRLALDALDQRRRQHRREVLGLEAPRPVSGEEGEALQAPEFEDEVEAAPPEGADRPFVRALVAEALGRLSEADRRVLVLRDVEGRSYEEIAGLLGCTVPAVGPRLTRARERLRQALDPEVGR